MQSAELKGKAMSTNRPLTCLDCEYCIFGEGYMICYHAIYPFGQDIHNDGDQGRYCPLPISTTQQKE
jgi:hypothetical protein